MHLSLVQDPFDFTTASFDVPVPPDALVLDDDAPTAETPYGLESLRYFFTDWEAGAINPAPHDFWGIALADAAGVRTVTVVPLVTARYLEMKVSEVFAQWQAVRSSRYDIKLTVRRCRVTRDDDVEAGLMVRLAR